MMVNLKLFTTQVNLRGHRCESTRVEPSLPCTRHLSQPSHDSLTNERVRAQPALAYKQERQSPKAPRKKKAP